MTEERSRLQVEFADWLGFETPAWGFSSRYVSIAPSAVNTELADAQRRVGEFLGLDQSAHWHSEVDYPSIFILNHLHRARRGPPRPTRMEGPEHSLWCLRQVTTREAVAMSSTENVPQEAADRDFERCASRPASLGPRACRSSCSRGSKDKEDQRRRQKMKTRTCLCWALAATGLAACGCGPEKPKTVGFLSDYSHLRPETKFRSSYHPDDHRLARYSQFIVDPVPVYLDEKSKLGPNANLEELARYLHDTMVRTLEPRYPVAGVAPGPGTGRIRMALTHLKRAGLTNRGEAAIEAELLDSQTGEQVVAFREIQRKRATASLHEWDDAKGIMHDWARRFYVALEEDRGRGRPRPVYSPLLPELGGQGYALAQPTQRVSQIAVNMTTRTPDED